MSISLRDQLLSAGFKEKQTRKATASKQPNSTANQHPGKVRNSTNRRISTQQVKHKSATDDAARRKTVKAKIRVLIETHHTADYSGENTHHFSLGNRIRQLHVNDTVRQCLLSGELLITRLNGETHLIPPAIAEQVLTLNSQWAVIRPPETAGEEDTAYANFPVPDDLQW